MEMMAEDEAKAAVGEDAVIKGVSYEEDVSIKRRTRHQYKILRMKWNNLVRF